MYKFELLSNNDSMKTLYIKLEKNTSISKKEVFLKDLADIIGTQDIPIQACENLKITTINPVNKTKKVIPISKIINCIIQHFPDLVIESIGAPEIVIEYEQKRKPNPILKSFKIISVCLISFFGTAFSIMAFHTDIGIRLLFKDIYTTFSQQPYPGISTLDISYSIGLSIGIIVFFNHIGKKKLTADPTPVEVELCLYEDNINQTLIDHFNNKKNSNNNYKD